MAEEQQTKLEKDIEDMNKELTEGFGKVVSAIDLLKSLIMDDVFKRLDKLEGGKKK